jgi:para-aminobenzoate synthetase/4-amino-4-deoxychorismate lyase
MNRRQSLPAELYDLIARTPATVLLECARTPDPESTKERVSRLFIDPLSVCVAYRASELPALFAEIEKAVASGLCAAGYFTYECGAFFEPTVAAGLPRADPSLPLAWFGIYWRPWLFDHETGAFRDGAPLGFAPHPVQNPRDEPASLPRTALGVSEQKYIEAVAAIHERIRSGDVYQLNFTIPLNLECSSDAATLYRALQRRQPVEYGAFVHGSPGNQILSFSPELFFNLEKDGEARRITTRPMKGTAPRGRTAREDSELASWLQNDPKNRAENVMIVDMLRNDLGRICDYGSVRAHDLFAVERHPTLLQMTSTVSGTLRPGVDFRQIFRALFPCGSITGAPKIRAMQLLAQLEAQPRGVYTGAIGFFSQQQTAFNVAIRTIELRGQSGTMGVGSGIVIDSDAAEEFRECQLKAEFLTRPASHFPKEFSLVETLLWQGDYPLIEFHLDRLEDSAGYFGFPIDRAEVRVELLAHAAGITNPEAPQSLQNPRKVRLLLDSEGEIHIASEPIEERLLDAGPLRVRMAAVRTDPQDPMLFHKTTHRPVYAKALAAANWAGFDDALFLNDRGEVSEGAIHNLFVEKDGLWLTPPIECGLLAGVYRRHLLNLRPHVEERVLHIEDLRNADAVYLCNAVRGVRLAVIDWEAD